MDLISQFTDLSIGPPLISLYHQIMSIQANNSCSRQTAFHCQRQRRFKRSNDKNSVSNRKCLSSCSSERSLGRFYMPASRICQNREFVDEALSKISNDCEKQLFTHQNKRKLRTTTEKFSKEILKSNGLQISDLMIEISELRNKNHELELELKAVKHRLHEFENKENRPLNRMRQKTQKQRASELEVENNHLRLAIQKLKNQMKELQDSRLTEQSSTEVIDTTFQLQNQIQNNGKEIFNLNAEISKLQIQIDFVNRRNYSELQTLKANHEKQLKVEKDRVEDLNKTIMDLKQKNNELKYIIKGTRQSKLPAALRLPKSQSLLSLSSDD